MFKLKTMEKTKMYSLSLYSNVPRALEHFIPHLRSDGVTNEMLDKFQSNIKDIIKTHREAERRIAEELDNSEFETTIDGQSWYATNGDFDDGYGITYIGGDSIGSIRATLEMIVLSADLLPYTMGVYGADIAYYVMDFGGGSYIICQVPNAHRLGIRIECQLNADNNIHDITQINIDPPLIAKVV